MVTIPCHDEHGRCNPQRCSSRTQLTFLFLNFVHLKTDNISMYTALQWQSSWIRPTFLRLDELCVCVCCVVLCCVVLCCVVLCVCVCVCVCVYVCGLNFPRGSYLSKGFSALQLTLCSLCALLVMSNRIFAPYWKWAKWGKSIVHCKCNAQQQQKLGHFWKWADYQYWTWALIIAVSLHQFCFSEFTIYIHIPDKSYDLKQ